MLSLPLREYLTGFHIEPCPAGGATVAAISRLVIVARAGRTGSQKHRRLSTDHGPAIQGRLRTISSKLFAQEGLLAKAA